MKVGWLGGLLVVVLGTVIGTLLGQVVGLLLPAGAAHDLFFKGITFGLKEPLHLDLAAIQLVFGLTLSVNPLTVVGLLLALFLVIRFAK